MPLDVHRMNKYLAFKGQRGHLHTMRFLNFRVTHRHSLGLEKGEGHFTADDELVCLVNEDADDMQLVNHL